MKILQINTFDISSGGAEQISLKLHDYYLKHDYEPYLAVGYKKSSEEGIIQIPNRLIKFHIFLDDLFLYLQNTDYDIIRKIFKRIVYRRRDFIVEIIRRILQPKILFNDFNGYEDFYYEGIHNLPSILPNDIDIVHLHNLHGKYFDLNALEWLSTRYPVVLTLHDLWCLTGHCAFPFECEKWKIGCGECPDLSIYPKINYDSTHENWKRKKAIYQSSRLYIATPSQWLMDKVKQSILCGGIKESRIIPNGIDISIFKPQSKKDSRILLNLPLNKKIILFVANGIRKNPWKDYATLEKAIKIIASEYKQEILFLGIGEDSEPIVIDGINLHFIPIITDSSILAKYYCAADVYVHPSKIETFSLTILEARACKTPVVASNVGAIPEQIINGVSGYLYSPGNYQELAVKMMELLENDSLSESFCENAYADVKDKYSLEMMAESYLSWYEEILTKYPKGAKH
jgi:glycosyltransferase involved in cell wall biosynthesis